ncbi:MAG: hypothetical protein ACREFH_11415, partial [Stellaceae bacterium]
GKIKDKMTVPKDTADEELKRLALENEKVMAALAAPQTSASGGDIGHNKLSSENNTGSSQTSHGRRMTAAPAANR